MHKPQLYIAFTRTLSLYLSHEKPCKGFFSFILTNIRPISIDVTVEGDLATTCPFIFYCRFLLSSSACSFSTQ